MRMILGSPILWALVTVASYISMVKYCDMFEQRDVVLKQQDLATGMTEAEANKNAGKRLDAWLFTNPIALALTAGWVCGFMVSLALLFRSL